MTEKINIRETYLTEFPHWMVCRFNESFTFSDRFMRLLKAIGRNRLDKVVANVLNNAFTYDGNEKD